VKIEVPSYEQTNMNLHLDALTARFMEDFVVMKKKHWLQIESVLFLVKETKL